MKKSLVIVMMMMLMSGCSVWWGGPNGSGHGFNDKGIPAKTSPANG